MAQARDYYISNSGSDSASGTLDHPFQTIQRAASVMVAGDNAYIRGGVYRETVIPSNSGTQNAPITFLPYNAESVIVSGADVISGAWSRSSGNIFRAPMSWDLGDGANQIFLDGKMMIEARWPNTTLDISHPTVATASSGSSAGAGSGAWSGTITDANLPTKPAGYWNGATINICLGSCWLWQTGPVTDSSTSKQLSFIFDHQGESLIPGAHSAYYLTGKLTELDAPAEWFRQSGTLYFWTPASDDPSQHTVEAKRRRLAFDLSNRSFIAIQEIGIFAATITTNEQTQYILLDGLECNYIAHTPIPLSQGSYNSGDSVGIALLGKNNVLRNSIIAFSSGSGVFLQGTGNRVFNNRIHDTDYRGTYASPIFAGTGFALQGQQLIAYNTIYNSARFGIYHSSAFGTGRILHNEIYDYGLQTNDLGCTYTWTSDGKGTEIAYNLCHDGHGLVLSHPQPYVAGIYLDDDTHNFVVHHNTVWNVPWAANLKSDNSKIYNNTFVGSTSSLMPDATIELTGTEYKNNIFAGPVRTNATGAVMTNNIYPGNDPQFADASSHNFQLKSTSPAIAAGASLPPYTNGFSGSAPDIGAYDHTQQPFHAGTQPAAYTRSAVTQGPSLAPGSAAIVKGTVPFDRDVTIVVTDGAGADLPAKLLSVIPSPPQLYFQVPSNATPGVALITITNGDGTVSLSSASVLPESVSGYTGQAVSSNGGSGTLTASSTSVFSTADWIRFSAGAAANTVNYQVSPNSGGARSTTITGPGISFTVEQQAGSIADLRLIGAMPHLAAQDVWTTAFTLVNKSSSTATARLSLFDDPSGQLSLPLNLPQQSQGTLLASSFDRQLSGNASLIVNSAGPQTPPVRIGSAQLSATGAVDGFAIFRLIPGSQEAVVPLETRDASSYLLVFDNTGGVVLGVALQNVADQPADIPIVIRDDTGAVIGDTSLSVAARGHMSFVLSSQYPFTANRRGTIEFRTPSGGKISVLGIRTTPLGNSLTLTTVPPMADIGTSGGSIAHIATGNGWQTSFVLVNTGSSPAQAQLNFFATGSGAPLSLPLTFPQSGNSTVASSVNQTLAAGATLIVQSAAPLSDPAPTIGSAQLTTNGNVGGFVVFRYNLNGQEAVVPLENRKASGYVIAFDNTSGTATGIALNSVSSQTVNVPVIVRDDLGNQIGSDTLTLLANAHTAFTLGIDKYPVTANRRGTIEFVTPPGGSIGALGIRIPPVLTFTSLPALAK